MGPNSVWGKTPEAAGEFSTIFVLKVTCKVTFNCMLQKNRGAGCTSCSSNNFVGGPTAPLLPRFPQVKYCGGIRPPATLTTMGKRIASLSSSLFIS